jgi:hypothetical protein
VSALGPRRTALVAVLIVATGLFAYGVLHERALIGSGHGESAAQLAREIAASKASESPAKRASETQAATGSESPAKRASETGESNGSESPAKRASETGESNGSESAAKRASKNQAANGSESPANRAGETSESGASGHAETAAEHAREGRVLGVDLESTPMIVLAILAGIALATLAASPLGLVRAILLALALVALAWSALDIREVVHQANESRTDLAIVAGLVAALHVAAAGLAVTLARRPADAHRRISGPMSTGAVQS